MARAALRSVSLIALVAATYILFDPASKPYLAVPALAAYGLVFMAAVTANRQAGHDLLARSIVVNRSALKTSASRDQLREQVLDKDAASRKRRRPSIMRMAADFVVLGVPVFILVTFGGVQHQKDLRYRTNYAIVGVAGMKTAVVEYQEHHSRWPNQDDEIGVAGKVAYPGGDIEDKYLPAMCRD